MPTRTPNRAETRPASPRSASALSHLLEPLRRLTARLDARQGLHTRWLIAAFAIALPLIFLRDPSLFTRPQFWAEDGKVWYAQAYSQGWLYSLFQPLNGYLSILPRLGAGAALLVPFRWAPLVMALEGRSPVASSTSSSSLSPALRVPSLLCFCRCCLSSGGFGVSVGP